jgi:hypothetical protein
VFSGGAVGALYGSGDVCPRGHVELAEDVAHVSFDRLLAEEEGACDLGIGAAVDYQPCHFELALGERLESLAVRLARPSAPGEPPAQLAQLVLGVVAIAARTAGAELAGGPLQLGDGALLLAGGRQRLPRQRAGARGIDPGTGLVRPRSRGKGPVGATLRR